MKSDRIQYFQELIGVLRWAVELGRVDILLETPLPSTNLVMPRAVHLHQVYLKLYPKRKLVASDAQLK